MSPCIQPGRRCYRSRDNHPLYCWDKYTPGRLCEALEDGQASRNRRHRVKLRKGSGGKPRRRRLLLLFYLLLHGGLCMDKPTPWPIGTHAIPGKVLAHLGLVQPMSSNGAELGSSMSKLALGSISTGAYIRLVLGFRYGPTCFRKGSTQLGLVECGSLLRGLPSLATTPIHDRAVFRLCCMHAWMDESMD